MIMTRETAPLLRAENLTMRFGGLTAVKQFGFEIMPGEIVGLIGPNGAGMTTCFNILTGFHKPTEGRVVFKGDDFTRWKPHSIAVGI